jgi:hypothetical protein
MQRTLSLLIVIITTLVFRNVQAQYTEIDAFQLDNQEWIYHPSNDGGNILLFIGENQIALHSLGSDTRLITIPSENSSPIFFSSNSESREFYTFNDFEEQTSYLYSWEADQLINLKTVLSSNGLFLVRDNFIAELIDEEIKIYDHDLNLLKVFSKAEIKILLAEFATDYEFIIGNFQDFNSLDLNGNSIYANFIGDNTENNTLTAGGFELNWNSDDQTIFFSRQQFTYSYKLGKYFCHNAVTYNAFRVNGIIMHTIPKNETLYGGNRQFPYIVKMLKNSMGYMVSIFDQQDLNNIVNNCENLVYHSLSKKNGPDTSIVKFFGITLFEPSVANFKFPTKYKNKKASVIIQGRNNLKLRWKKITSGKYQIDEDSNLGDVSLDLANYDNHRIIIKVNGINKVFSINIVKSYS